MTKTLFISKMREVKSIVISTTVDDARIVWDGNNNNLEHVSNGLKYSFRYDVYSRREFHYLKTERGKDPITYIAEELMYMVSTGT